MNTPRPSDYHSHEPLVAGGLAGGGPAGNLEPPADADLAQWLADHPLPAANPVPGDSAGRAAQALDPVSDPIGPGFAPNFADEDPDADIARKVPRQLHLWFAAALGVLVLVTLLGQRVIAAWWSPVPAPAKAVAAPATETEPPLTRLQHELARQKGELEPADGRRAPGKPGGSPLASALAAPVPPGVPGTADTRFDASVPPGLLDPDAPIPSSAADAGSSYEARKAQSLVAGSRILALSHVAADSLTQAGDLPAAIDGNRGADRIHQLADLLRGAPELVRALPDLMTGLVNRSGPGSPTGVSGSATAAGVTAAAAVAGVGSFPVLTAGPPASVPLIQEGTPIPCILLNELRSDLPGMIVAQVSEDVYDSVRAEQRLIPRGTRLVGRYDSQTSNGQQRLFASFHRMILPGGASVDLQRMEAADRIGGAGLQDQIDTHFWSRFGQAFLTAGLAQAAQRDGGAASITTVSGGVLPGPNATGQILVDTARGSLQAGASLAPTLVIRRGTEFNVMVNKDLALTEVAP